MIGINYRYEIDPARPGIVKLGCTKGTLTATLVATALSFLPLLVLFGLAELDSRKYDATIKKSKKTKKR